MNKGKFASLILLGAFSAGVASSSAVSAQGDSNLASVLDNKAASSHDNSVPIDPKVSNEPMVDADENNIDVVVSAENNKNEDYLFVDKTKKVKKVNLAKVLAIAAGGLTALGGATFGISKLVKSSGNDKNNKPSTDSTADPNPESDKPTDSKKEEKEPDKKDEPSPETNPESDKPTGSEEEEKELEEKEEKDPEEKFKKEEKGGFATWYKNNLGVSIPLTYILWIIGYMIVVEIRQRSSNGDIEKGIFLDFAESKDYRENEMNIKPLAGLFKNFTNKKIFTENAGSKGTTVLYKGFKRLLVNFIAAATFANYKCWLPRKARSFGY